MKGSRGRLTCGACLHTPGASGGYAPGDLWQDLRYAARTFRRQPGFAATAVLTLALGLGSATAIFAWVDRTFLQPLQVHEPDRLFNLGARLDGGRVSMAFSYPEYLDYRRFDDVFAGLVAFDSGATVVLDSGTSVERARVALVSANFFSVLGVRPILGSPFDAGADETPGAHPVAVLSYAAWQRLFSREPDVVGRSVRLNGHGFTVIGVAPKAVLTLVARGRGDAAGPVTAIRDAARSLDPQIPPYMRTLAAVKTRSLAGARRTTEISSVFGFLCLVVSAVGLYGVLTQAVALRSREIAIRMALGAARTRTMGMIVGDAMVLLGFALVPGLGGALVVSRLLSTMLYESVRLDLPTVVAATALLGLVALVAAWRPARRAANVDPMVALRAE